VLDRLTEHLAEDGADPAVLRRAWEAEPAGEVRDALTLLLGLRGEADLKPAVRDYLLERKHPMRLRQRAARALGGLAIRTGDFRQGEALAAVIRRDLQGQYTIVEDPAGKEPPRRVLVYVVREEAGRSIRRMQKAGLSLPS
jgi:hypothetical protein